MYKTITIDTHAGFTVLTLNKPETMNAMSAEMISESLDAIESLKNNDTCRALIITGAGKSFCSGADLKDSMTNEDGSFPNIEKRLKEGFNKLILSIQSLEIPSIAAVNGACAGAGVGIALATDIVIASDEAYFLQAFVHIALIPDAGCTWFLPRLVGSAKAKAMMMLGEKVSATDAEQMGLIYKVVDSDTLMETVETLATKMAKGPTKTYKLIKSAWKKSHNNSLEDQLNTEAATQRHASLSEDFFEGVQAFGQKRTPHFKGK